MVRAIMVQKVLPTKFAQSCGTALNWSGSNPVDGMRVRITGRTFFMVWNTGGTPFTLTIQSAPDLYGRTKSIVKSIAGGEQWLSPVFPVQGWAQPDQYLYVDTPDANLRVYSFEIPPN